MNDLINRLKVNENPHRIFADMSEEEQECLKKVGPLNCKFLTCEYKTNSNLNWNELGCSSHFLPVGIYRIKPDYQPEPEYVDLPIEEKTDFDGQWLGVRRIPGMNLPIAFTFLHMLPSLPGFVGFQTQADNCVRLSDVANLHAAGFKIIARFRK
jgi:hypothetical protein